MVSPSLCCGRKGWVLPSRVPAFKGSVRIPGDTYALRGQTKRLSLPGTSPPDLLLHPISMLALRTVIFTCLAHLLHCRQSRSLSWIYVSNADSLLLKTWDAKSQAWHKKGRQHAKTHLEKRWQQQSSGFVQEFWPFWCGVTVSRTTPSRGKGGKTNGLFDFLYAGHCKIKSTNTTYLSKTECLLT